MEQVDTIFVADGGKAATFQRTAPAFPSPSEQTLGRRSLFDGLAAFFAQIASDSKPRSDNALGKYDPFLTLY